MTKKTLFMAAFLAAASMSAQQIVEDFKPASTYQEGKQART